MVNRKVKIIMVVFLLFSSVITVLLITIFTFPKSETNVFSPNDYEVKSEVIGSEKEKSLDKNIIYKLIDHKILASSIKIARKVVVNNDVININYNPEFNKDKFQYLFIKQFIKVFPQWKTNKLSFFYNELNNKVAINYEQNDSNHDEKLNWLFTINNKIAV